MAFSPRWLATTIATCALCVGCAGGAQSPKSHVARLETPVTGIADFDRFFQTIHSMQVTVNEAERTKFDAIAALAAALALAENADLAACAAAIRAHVERLQSASVHVSLRLEVDDEHSQEQRLVQDIGAIAPGADRRAIEGAARAIESALSLRGAMLAMRSSLGEMRRTAESLRRTVTQRSGTHAASVDLEFQDAIAFLDGVAPRASAQADDAQHIALRLVASATLAATAGAIDAAQGSGDAPKTSVAARARVPFTQEARPPP